MDISTPVDPSLDFKYFLRAGGALVLFLLTKQKKEEKWILCPFVSAKGRSAGWRSTGKSVLPGDKPKIQIENETSRLLNQIASINNSLWRKKWVPNPENRKKLASLLYN